MESLRKNQQQIYIFVICLKYEQPSEIEHYKIVAKEHSNPTWHVKGKTIEAWPFVLNWPNLALLNVSWCFHDE